MTHLARIHEIQKSLQSWIKEDSHKRICIVKDAETFVYVPNDHIATLLKAFDVMRNLAIAEHECRKKLEYKAPTHGVDEQFERRMETHDPS